MLIVIFLLVLCAGMFVAYRLLSAEMYLSLNRPVYFSWGRSHVQESSVEPSAKVEVIDHLPTAFDVPLQPEEMPAPITEKIHKMDLLLLEKNKMIHRLQTQLEAERSNRENFERVKLLMDQEINHLRQQIKGFKQFYKEKDHA